MVRSAGARIRPAARRAARRHRRRRRARAVRGDARPRARAGLQRAPFAMPHAGEGTRTPVTRAPLVTFATRRNTWCSFVTASACQRRFVLVARLGAHAGVCDCAAGCGSVLSAGHSQCLLHRQRQRRGSVNRGRAPALLPRTTISARLCPRLSVVDTWQCVSDSESRARTAGWKRGHDCRAGRACCEPLVRRHDRLSRRA